MKEAPPQLEHFPYHTGETVRMRDLDHQNHVNNAVFSTYLETGRVTLLRELFGDFRQDGGFVLARLEIDYLRELLWPGSIVIGTRVGRLGNTSVTFTQGVFAEEVCVARGQSTLVRMDRATHRPAPFTPEMADQLKSLMR